MYYNNAFFPQKTIFDAFIKTIKMSYSALYPLKMVVLDTDGTYFTQISFINSQLFFFYFPEK